MALVTVTGKAWDHDRDPIPTNLQPELWFRPVASSITTAGLLSQREVKATLSSNGDFTVDLESFPDALYVPTMRWLTDPSQADESVENRARGYDEWPAIYPGEGGPIGQLPGVVRLGGVWYGFGEPPEVLKRRNDVIYMDITGPGIGLWVPANARFAEGVVI